MKTTTSRVLRTGLNQIVKNAMSRLSLQAARNAWDMSEEQFWQYQARAFEDIYAFAQTRIPFYRERPDAYPELPLRPNVLNTLAHLPILSKSTVKAENASFWPTPLKRFTSFHATSGTSGTPLRIPATIIERSRSTAVLGSWYEKICGTTSPRTLVLSGFLSPEPGSRDLYWRDRIGNQLFLSIYSLNSANKDEIRDIVRKFRPQLIYGYASAVNQLADLFPDEDMKYKNERVAVVTSEVLEPYWRQNIESSVVRRVYDLYGSQEGAHAAFECEHGELHINPIIGIIEIVDESGNSVPNGEVGRVLITSLLRKSFPLIRYAIGDVAESRGYAAHCACGLNWPIIGNVQGRSEDLVRTRDGRKIGYLCFHATKDLQGIKEAQLVQRDYESFEFFIVQSEVEHADRTVNEISIQSNLQRRIQTPVNVTFSYVDEIRRGPNGKFKAVVVDIKSDERK